MPAIQTVFNEDIAPGLPGAAANGELSNDISLHLEGSTDCAFGRPVYRGVGDKGATLVVSANLRGFALRSQSLPETSTRAADSYGNGDTMAVRERGAIWVASTTSAADNDQVYVTAGGSITNVVGANTIATGWFFDQTIAAPGFVVIVRR